MMTNKKTSVAQLEAVARYQTQSIRWTVTAKNNTKRAELLDKAKQSGTLPDKFWAFLEQEYD